MTDTEQIRATLTLCLLAAYVTGRNMNAKARRSGALPRAWPPARRSIYLRSIRTC